MSYCQLTVVARVGPLLLEPAITDVVAERCRGVRASFLICLLTALTFFWLLIWAAVALVPLSVLNLAGLAWALTVGTWRWRILQQEQAVEATAKLLRPHKRRPNFTSLRAIEIVAAGIAGLLLLALGYAIYLWLFVVYKGAPHH